MESNFSSGCKNCDRTVFYSSAVNAFYSAILSVAVIPREKGSYELFFGSAPSSAKNCREILSFAYDWDQIQYRSVAGLRRQLTARTLAVRAVSLIESLLIGLSKPLEEAAILEVERALKKRSSRDPVLSGLLKAPLASPARALLLANSATTQKAHQFSGLLLELVSLQQRLGVFCEAWIDLDESYFSDLGLSREQI